MYMTVREKIEACLGFLNALAKELGESYELVGSCNKDISMYLIPKGTIDELSYYGKPVMSFRFSDHWNWFSNARKCNDRYHVQCNSTDIPWPNWRRHDDDRATEPRTGFQVAIYGADKKYHCVFGDRYNRKTCTWRWKANDPKVIAAMILEARDAQGA